jgi:chorismate synthase
MASTYGTLFRIMSFGESHGPALGVVVDGCPPNLPLREEDLLADLRRRRPGQSRLTTPRREEDRPEILSGVWKGRTLGTPIAILVRNRDARSKDYRDLRQVFRPSHADYTYLEKYGIRDHRGGGRASARETVARVAAGAIARKLLRHRYGTTVLGYVVRIHRIDASVDPETVTARRIEASPVRCPDRKATRAMIETIEKAAENGDSVGGVVECVARGVPAGLGEPVFDKLHADLARGVMSLPATRGFEIGMGFDAVSLTGMEHNDPFEVRDGSIVPATNRAGGVLGGISSGETVRFRVAFKPPSSVAGRQDTVDARGRRIDLTVRGRHDPCVVPRAVPLVEAMCTLTLADHVLRHEALCGPIRTRNRRGEAKPTRTGSKTKPGKSKGSRRG